MIRVGVVGAGGIARSGHLPAYDAHPRCRLCAVADPDPDRRKDTANDFSLSRTYETGSDLIVDEDLDAISICSPPNTHRDLFVKAAEAGYDIYCEKPFTTSLEKAEEMVSIARSQNIVTQLGYSLRFANNYQKVLTYVKNGIVGEIASVDISVLVPPPRSSWYYDPDIAGGGIVADRLAHWLDFYLALFDVDPEITDVTLRRINTDDVEDYAEIDMQFDDVSMSFTLMWVQSGVTSTTTLQNELIGTHGVLKFDRKHLEGNIRGNGVYFKHGATPTVAIGPLFQWWYDASEPFMQRPISLFVDRISGDTSIDAPTAEQGLHIMQLKDEIYDRGSDE